MTSIRASIAGAVALSLLVFGAASAQDAPPAGGGAPAPLTPTESKPFGDWTVRCFAVSTQSPCDMFEMLVNKTTSQRVLSVSIAYLPTSDKHVIQIAVPLGFLIQKGVVLASDAYTSPMLHYRRCDRGGCYVEMLIDNQTIDALAAATGPAKIRVVAEGGKVFDIPLSLNGFGDAHGAMSDLARKKTAAAAPAPAETPPAPATTPAPAPDTTPAPDATTPTTP
jgi:invasion protein IalB